MSWTHVLFSNDDMVAVARDIQETAIGTFATVFFIALECPEEIYMSIADFELLNLETAAPWFRQWVETEVRAAELQAA